MFDESNSFTSKQNKEEENMMKIDNLSAIQDNSRVDSFSENDENELKILNIPGQNNNLKEDDESGCEIFNAPERNEFEIIKVIKDTDIEGNPKGYTRVYRDKEDNGITVDFSYICRSVNGEPLVYKISFFFQKNPPDLSKCKTKEEIINEINNKKTEPELNFYFDLYTLEQAQKLEPYNTRNYILHLKTKNFEEDSKNYFPKLKNHFLQAFIVLISINPCFIETNENIDYWINVFTELNEKINNIRQVEEDDLTNQMVKKIEEIVTLLKNAKNDITNKLSTKQKNISKIQDDYNLQINCKLQDILEDILELMAIERINNNSICGCNLCGCVPCCRYF